MSKRSSEYIVVGDLHGKTEVLDYALTFNLPLIFVGDYLDSFERPTKDHIDLLFRVLELSEQGRAITLAGNHEWSYLDPKKYMCSGYRYDLGRIMTPDLKERMRDRLYNSVTIGHWFITHAGVSAPWLEMARDLHPEIAKDSENLEDFLYRIPEETFTTVGRRRGGVSYGGPIWCDLLEYSPIPDTNQIFGHTPGQNIRHMEHGENESFCIDCLDNKVNLLFINNYNRSAECTYPPTEWEFP
jgi:hypothetical protein